MSIVDEIKKIDSNLGIVVALFFFSIIGPGALIIFLFKTTLFIDLDIIKLILLATSIASLGVIAPYALSIITAKGLSQKHNIPIEILTTPNIKLSTIAFNNACTMYLLLFLAYSSDWSISMFINCFMVSILIASINEGVGLFRASTKYIETR